MKYTLHVSITDRDYQDFNLFSMTKTPYGKKQTRSFRLMLVCLCVLLLALSLLTDDTLDAWSVFCSVTFHALVCVIAQLLWIPILRSSAKGIVKRMAKSGKKPYSASAMLEFDEDFFIETTDDNRTEVKYAALERVCDVRGRVLYLFVNSTMAYLIPTEAFASAEEREDFLSFMKAKCACVEYYDK